MCRQLQWARRAASVLDDRLPACEELGRVLSRSLDSVLCHARPAVGLHIVTASALPLLKDWSADELPRVRRWCLYVDDSNTCKGGGWSVAVVALCKQPPHLFVGTTWGPTLGTKDRAEHQAVCWATYIACLLPGPRCHPL